MRSAAATAPARRRPVRAAAPHGHRKPIASPRGYSQRPHSMEAVTRTLTYGAYVLLESIVAYVTEGSDPPKWAGEHGWFRPGDEEPVSWIEYWMWRKNAADERAAWDARDELIAKGLIETRERGFGTLFKPRFDRFWHCEPRKPRGGWTRKPPGRDEGPDADAELEEQDDRAALELVPPKRAAAKLDCPLGLPCPVHDLVQIQGVWRNPEGENAAKDDSVSAAKSADAENPLNSSSANRKRTEWEAVKAALQRKLTPAAYQNWVERTEETGRHDDVIAVAVPDEATKIWLEEEYPDEIAAALRKTGVREVRYVVREGPATLPQTPPGEPDTEVERLQKALIHEFGGYILEPLTPDEAQRILDALAAVPLSYLIARARKRLPEIVATRKTPRWHYLADMFSHDARNKWLREHSILLPGESGRKKAGREK